MLVGAPKVSGKVRVPMEFKRRTLNQIADMICGNTISEVDYFVYRSSTYLTEFFEDIDREEFFTTARRENTGWRTAWPKS
jgi:hypothetical protein